MHPVRDFKANFSQPAKTESMTDTGLPNVAADMPLHEADSSARNLCFVWPDGRQIFLNYAHLIMGEFESNTERNVIKLGFSSHTVILQGYSLKTLFMALLDHLPRIITAVDARYILPEDKQKSIVIEIAFNKTES